METIKNYLTPTDIYQECQMPEKDGDLISPIGSITKSFNGLGVALFFIDDSNKYLLGNKKANEITIKELLLNKKTTAKNNKLEEINKWLNLCKINKDFANLTLKELAGHTSGITRVKEEYIFSPEISKMSKTKNPSMFKRLDDGIPIDNSGYVTNTDLFLKQFETELGIDVNKKGKFIYNNNGFYLLYELMSLMSDEKDFFEEIRNRILKPLNLEDKIMPFYEVQYKDRTRFPINYTWIDIDEINEVNSVYSLGFVDNGSGSLCATTNALKIYAEQLGNFILGNDNKLIPNNKNKEAKEFYKSFIVNNAIEHPDLITTKSQYSLGIYINEGENVKYFSHSGSLPAAQARMCILFDNNKIKDIKVITWQNEIFSNIANNFFLSSIRAVTGKSIDKKVKSNFEKVLKEEFIEGNINTNKKKEICKILKQTYEFIEQNKENKNFYIKLKENFKDLNVNSKILKAFSDLVLTAVKNNNCQIYL